MVCSANSCPYANILGVPGEGFHSTRIFGLALNDIIGTIVIALIISYFFKVSFIKSVIGLFVLAELLHYLFGTRTALLVNLGLL